MFGGKDGKWLCNLRFADDVARISGEAGEIQAMAEELCKANKKAGLIINTKKTIIGY